MTLDERFEQLLAGPSETLAVASVSALAESVGQAAADRLMQIAATGTRSVVQVAANEGLASIGSEQALSYLREKMKNAGRHDEACFQLAELRHPAAELLLSRVAKAVQDEITL